MRPDEAESVKFKITEKGSYKVIDRVTVNVDVEKGLCFGKLYEFGLNKSSYFFRICKKTTKKLLEGGIWAIVRLAYFDPSDCDVEMETAERS